MGATYNDPMTKWRDNQVAVYIFNNPLLYERTNRRFAKDAMTKKINTPFTRLE